MPADGIPEVCRVRLQTDFRIEDRLRASPGIRPMLNQFQQRVRGCPASVNLRCLQIEDSIPAQAAASDR